MTKERHPMSEAVSGGTARDLESHARLPEKGRNQEDILRELRGIAAREDARWETGQISGSYYHAGKEHFGFLNQVYGLFSHVNILQRDMCPRMLTCENSVGGFAERVRPAGFWRRITGGGVDFP